MVSTRSASSSPRMSGIRPWTAPSMEKSIVRIDPGSGWMSFPIRLWTPSTAIDPTEQPSEAAKLTGAFSGSRDIESPTAHLAGLGDGEFLEGAEEQLVHVGAQFGEGGGVGVAGGAEDPVEGVGGGGGSDGETEAS